MSDLPNAFVGWEHQPGDEDLARVLGKAKPVWDRMVAEMGEAVGAMNREWKSYSKKWGWTLRLLRGRRTIVWMAPHVGCFQAMFILGGKAMAAAREYGLPAGVMKILDEAPKYPEGFGVRLIVKGPRDLGAIRKLARVKIEN